ncbi:MAG: DUF1292 domain-containing protein [Halanaerobiales bacterium]
MDDNNKYKLYRGDILSKEVEKIIFKIEGSKEKVEFYVIEQVTINNATYILVTEAVDDGDEIEVMILKEKDSDEEEVVYEILENNEELVFVSKIFAEKIKEFDFDI